MCFFYGPLATASSVEAGDYIGVNKGSLRVSMS